MQTPFFLDQKWADRVVKMWRKLQNVKVVGGTVRSSEDDLTITVSPPSPRSMRQQSSGATADTIGLYQGQVHTMVTDLVDGWDFVKVHGV